MSPSAPYVLALAGTRPEVIKLAPVLRALRARGLRAELGVTGQHEGLLRQALDDFELTPVFDLELMRHGQSPSALLGRSLLALEEPLAAEAPAAVLVQGDTTSALAGALAASGLQVPLGHVEAGLRSGDPRRPFPEELNRRLIADLARWHFAPSPEARAELLAEGITPAAIHVVGNTVLDACQALAGGPLPAPLAAREAAGELDELVLVTLHRRELTQPQGAGPAPLVGVLAALAELCRERPELCFVFPAHPAVRPAAEAALGAQPNALLLPPQPYPSFLALLGRARLALSDSGGVQEEGPALGTPVLVVRDATERPEAVACGGVELVGTDPARVLAAARAALAAPLTRAARFPYGSGGAAASVAEVLAAELSEPRAEP